MSPCSRLYFSVGSFSLISRSLYDNFFKGIISLVALFWIISMSSMSPFLYRHHTETAYSMCVLTNDLYNITNVCLSICIKFLLINPIILYALFILSCICCLKFNLKSNITPKSLIELTISHETGSVTAVPAEGNSNLQTIIMSLRQDPDDVPHCRNMSSDKVEWWLIPAMLCRGRKCQTS